MGYSVDNEARRDNNIRKSFNTRKPNLDKMLEKLEKQTKEKFGDIEKRNKRKRS